MQSIKRYFLTRTLTRTDNEKYLSLILFFISTADVVRRRRTPRGVREIVIFTFTTIICKRPQYKSNKSKYMTITTNYCNSLQHQGRE